MKRQREEVSNRINKRIDLMQSLMDRVRSYQKRLMEAISSRVCPKQTIQKRI